MCSSSVSLFSVSVYDKVYRLEPNIAVSVVASMKLRATVSEQGVRLYAGAGNNLGLHLNLRAFLQQPASSQQQPKTQEQETESAQLPATPDSNATTLVLLRPAQTKRTKRVDAPGTNPCFLLNSTSSCSKPWCLPTVLSARSTASWLPS